MYQLNQIIKDLEHAHELLSRREFPTNASLHVQWALQSARGLALWLGPMDGGISKATNPHDNVGQPLWLLDIPKYVALVCPHCHARVECEVEIAEESNRYDGTRTAHAEIEDADFCEDCGRRLCPRCPRFPHPDDDSLLQCEECHETAAKPADPVGDALRALPVIGTLQSVGAPGSGRFAPCAHTHLDTDGICHACGQDCRRG